MAKIGKIPRWPLHDAKNRFSELVSEAERGGPQIVTRRGADTAVVLSLEDYDELTRRARGPTLAAVLRSAPKVPGGLDTERSKDLGRQLDLTVATRNTSDLARSGAPLFDPWGAR